MLLNFRRIFFYVINFSPDSNPVCRNTVWFVFKLLNYGCVDSCTGKGYHKACLVGQKLRGE